MKVSAPAPAPSQPRAPVPWPPATLVFLVGTVVRLAFGALVLARRGPAGLLDTDSPEYLRLALNLLGGHGFSLDDAAPFRPDHSRTPLYPLLLLPLTAAGHPATLVVFLQALFGGATAGLAAALAARLGADRRGQLTAGLLVALDVASVSFAALVMTEIPFTLLIVLAAWVMAEPRGRQQLPRVFAGGALLALALLCRPAALLLPLVVVPFLVVTVGSGRRWACAGAFMAGALLVLSPWLVRNVVTFDRVFITTLGNKNLAMYRAPGAIARDEGISLEEAQARVHAEALATFDGDPDERPVDFRAHEGRVALGMMKAHPVATLAVHASALPSLLFKPLRSNVDLQLGLADRPTAIEQGELGADGGLLRRLRAETSAFSIALSAVQIVLVLLLWVLFVRGARAGLTGSARADIALLLLFIGYFIAVSTELHSYARFRIPFVPLVAAVAGLGLTRRPAPGGSGP